MVDALLVRLRGKGREKPVATMPRVESATAATRFPRRGRTLSHVRGVDPSRLARLGLLSLVLVAVAGFLLYPTYPNYDSVYSLLWGRELLSLETLSFEAYRAPTQHPAAIAFAVLLQPLGSDAAGRVMVFITLLAMVGVVAGVYRLASRAFTPLVGFVAAALMATRFDFPFLAVRAYIDIPYITVVLWAAILEYERPRRGWPVFALLVIAGTMRPEAWVLAGLYFLWMAFGPDAERLLTRWWHRRGARVAGAAPPAKDTRETPQSVSWGSRARYAAWAAAGPAIWAATDFAVTGNPLYSLTSTSELAEELGRQRSLSDVPVALPEFFTRLVKTPVLYGALLGIALGLWFAPKRVVMPAILLITGVGTFIMVGLAGLSVIDRYLIVPAVALVIFAALALGGFTMLERATIGRRLWGIAAVVAVVVGMAWTASNPPSLASFDEELTWRSDTYRSLDKLLTSPEVKDRIAAGCLPVSAPSHKIMPDIRWIADLPADQVLARSDPAVNGERGPDRVSRGIAIYVQGGRRSLERHGFASNTDPLTQIPQPGFVRIRSEEHYSAYANCGG